MRAPGNDGPLSYPTRHLHTSRLPTATVTRTFLDSVRSRHDDAAVRVSAAAAVLVVAVAGCTANGSNEAHPTSTTDRSRPEAATPVAAVSVSNCHRPPRHLSMEMGAEGHDDMVSIADL